MCGILNVTATYYVIQQKTLLTQFKTPRACLVFNSVPDTNGGLRYVWFLTQFKTPTKGLDMSGF